ncbi:MAG: hypothetical protein R3E39_28500 [Anaerolineae bacterium]
MSTFDRNSAPVSRLANERQPVSSSHLHYIVETELARHLQSGKSFTAYGVTLALRENYPMLDIVHQRVRKIVQTRMAKLAVPYRKKMQMHGGAWAMTYIPASINLIPADSDRAWEQQWRANTARSTFEAMMLDINAS